MKIIYWILGLIILIGIGIYLFSQINKADNFVKCINYLDTINYTIKGNIVKCQI